MAHSMDQLTPGFESPVYDAQRVFRALLEAVSHPGRIVKMYASVAPPAPLLPGTGAVCLTLLDFETPLWTDLAPESSAVSWLRFHCGVPFTEDPSEAAFGLIVDPRRMPELARFHPGEEVKPELSTTLLIQVTGLNADGGLSLRGPGIASISRLRVEGLPAGFWEDRKGLEGLFPLGTDLVFIAGRRVAAVPRSTSIED